MGAVATAVDEMVPRKGRSPWLLVWRRLMRRRIAPVCLAIIAIVYLAGLLAPWVAPYDYKAQNLENAFARPSLAHPFGTDRLGRDVLSRIIWGARTAVVISVLAVTLGTALGIVLGGVAGYLGGWVDMVLMRIGDILFAFPGMLLLIIIAATIKPRVTEWAASLEQALGFRGLVEFGYIDYIVVFTVLGFVGWPGMARLVRSQVLSIKESAYADAARAIGCSTWRIITRHILPNALPPVLVQVSMGLGGAVTAEVGLSWLGIGVQPPNPSWGIMIAENQGMMRFHPHLLVIPAAVVGLVFFAFNLLGDALNDALNPRSR